MDKGATHTPRGRPRLADHLARADRLTVRLPRDLGTVLRCRAVAQHRTVTAVVESLLRSALGGE